MCRHLMQAIVFNLCLAGLVTAQAATTATTTSTTTSSTGTTSLTTQTNTMDQLAESMDSSKATSKFASDFSTFAGSQDNAQALIGGLRNGTPIVLTGSTTTTSTTGVTATSLTQTTIVPPTRPLGYGGSYIALSLAKAQLAQYGITQPTPTQLQAALTGGSLTITTVTANGTTQTKTVSLSGILTQRAAGLGWGQIAKADGLNLGRVISAMKTENKHLAAATGTHHAPVDGNKTHEAHSGKTHVEHSTSKISHAEEHGHEHYASGRGITNALGGGGVVYGKSHEQSGTRLASINGGSHAHVSSIVTASGASATGAAAGKSANAGEHGKGAK